MARGTDRGLETLGWLGFTDTVRTGAADVITELGSPGVEHIAMLTGDNDRVDRRIGEELGVDEVRSELLPEQNVAVVDGLVPRYGSVAMVGHEGSTVFVSLNGLRLPGFR